MSILIVASPTLSPLSTAAPPPTDDCSQGWRCECGHRVETNGPVTEASHIHPGPPRSTVRMLPDGPFPRTVAVWTETRYCTANDTWGECDPACTACEEVGAVTHTVEVTGPSHHANECEPGRWCGKEASWSDAWHTPTDPTSIVTLDTPIPCEQPWECGCIGEHSDDEKHSTAPASVWTDDTITATLETTKPS